MKRIPRYGSKVFTVKVPHNGQGLLTVVKGKSDSSSKLSGKNARLKRQASELRKNLFRRKEQARVRAAQQPRSALPQDEEERGT